MNESQGLNKRRAKREFILKDVEFYVTEDIIAAMTVDVSKTGVRIDMGRPITVRMWFEHGDQLLDRKAQLAWSSKTPDGGMSYGFEYLPDGDEGSVS
ncbi:MAG TPA: PilZ domain-containing protein [archaeon]|nr:PilZ domain-containing protein [archaeon]